MQARFIEIHQVFAKKKKNQVNIRIELKEAGINTRNWIDSAQDKDY